MVPLSYDWRRHWLLFVCVHCIYTVSQKKDQQCFVHNVGVVFGLLLIAEYFMEMYKNVPYNRILKSHMNFKLFLNYEHTARGNPSRGQGH